MFKYQFGMTTIEFTVIALIGVVLLAAAVGGFLDAAVECNKATTFHEAMVKCIHSK